MGEAALIASAVFTAGAAIVQGRAVAAAEEVRRRQLEQQKRITEIKTLDEANERRRRLELALGEGAAIGGASGLDPFASGSSFLAIREETERLAEEDIRAIRLIGAQEIGRLNAEQVQSRIAGNAALTAGFLSAGAAGASAGFRISQLGGGTSSFNTVGARGNFFGPGPRQLR